MMIAIDADRRGLPRAAGTHGHCPLRVPGTADTGDGSSCGQWLRRQARSLVLLPAILAMAACASTPQPRADGTVLLRGPASAVVNDCHFDAICTVTVQGVTVTTMSGLRTQPAPVWGQSSGQPQPGQVVEVLCKATGARSCTLLGSERYYLRAIH